MIVISDPVIEYPAFLLLELAFSVLLPPGGILFKEAGSKLIARAVSFHAQSSLLQRHSQAVESQYKVSQLFGTGHLEPTRFGLGFSNENPVSGHP